MIVGKSVNRTLRLMWISFHLTLVVENNFGFLQCPVLSFSSFLSVGLTWLLLLLGYTVFISLFKVTLLRRINRMKNS